MKTRTGLLALLWTLLVCHPAGAQTTTTTYQLGLGSTDILDTYLSQEKFSGAGLTLLTTSERWYSERWNSMLQNQVNLSGHRDTAADGDCAADKVPARAQVGGFRRHLGVGRAGLLRSACIQLGHSRSVGFGGRH